MSKQGLLVALSMAAGLSLAVGCSESTEGNTTMGTGTTTSTGTGTGGGGTTSGGGGGMTGTGGGGMGGGGGSGGGLAAVVVINEVSAVGDDWIELYNTSSSAVDLSGYGITDDDGGVPKLDAAARFSAGTTIEPGGYLMVLADQPDPVPEGPQDDCLEIVPAPCFYASYGISAGGDRIYLLSPADEVVTEAEYPADATIAGQTWGRLPNGTGDFMVNGPTPGEANAGL